MKNLFIFLGGAATTVFIANRLGRHITQLVLTAEQDGFDDGFEAGREEGLENGYEAGFEDASDDMADDDEEDVERLENPVGCENPFCEFCYPVAS